MIRELAATRTLRLSFPADFTWRIYSVNATEGPGGGMYGSGRRGVYPEFMLNELTSHGPLPIRVLCRRTVAAGGANSWRRDACSRTPCGRDQLYLCAHLAEVP
eukprot:7386500-Prymnesium_polylepis.1